ncbi:MAG: tryptophan synthase subunit alpha [Actinomycetota bacterium]
MSRFVADAISERSIQARGALIGYLPVGFPDLQTSIDAAVAILENGVDAIELGLPYSDPVMDGGVIQAAAHSALESGFRTPDVFTAIAAIRARVDAPVLVMTYANPVEQYGVQRFAEDLAAAGAAGMVTPDLTPDTAPDWIQASDQYGLERVFLAAPSSTDARLELISAATNGFVYAASTMGVTGARGQVGRHAQGLVERIRDIHNGHVCLGIGISTANHVHEVLEYADGVIVGSALVHALNTGGVKGVAAFAANLGEGTASQQPSAHEPVPAERSC